MKRISLIIPTGILLAMNIALTSSCSSAAKNDNSDEDSLTVKVEERGYEYCIFYDSKNAQNALPYKKGEKYDSPLSLKDCHSRGLEETDIDDVWGMKMNGVPTYSVMLINTANDSIVIESIELPDTRFKVSLGTPVYQKGMLAPVTFLTDSLANINDYRFIINYKGDKYPPQTFHVNFYRDKASADKAYEERTSGEVE